MPRNAKDNLLFIDHDFISAHDRAKLLSDKDGKQRVVYVTRKTRKTRAHVRYCTLDWWINANPRKRGELHSFVQPTKE